MRRMSAVAGLALGLALGLASGPAAWARPLTLHFTLVTVASRAVDNPPAAKSPTDASPGDQFVFTERALSGGRQVGRDAGVCIAVNRSRIVCDATLWLFGRGAIVLHSGGVGPAAVVGGTGEFAGRRGAALIRRLGGPRTSLTIRLG